MRRFMICVLALLLAGCWTSARPDIPLGELVQPPGLPGRYWTVALEEMNSPPELIEFRRGDGGTMIGDNAGKSNGGPFRLVRTAVPGVYLKITDYDEDSVYYGLLEHRELGTWQEYGIREVAQDAFAGPSLAWMQEIAGLHGLSLDTSDPDETRIEGNVDGLAIPSLFGDPAFLATLRVEPVQLYLPGPPAPEEREELFPTGETSFPLEVDQASLPGAEWVAPAGLEGEFVQSLSYAHFVRPVGLRFMRLPDGRFELLPQESQNAQGRSRIMGVLPLEGLENEFLAVNFDYWKYENQERNYLTLSILRRTETGWSIARILVRGTETLVGRQDLLSQPMNEAAQRQGASLDGFKLRGGLTAPSLLALLKDGQFTTGLEIWDEAAEQYGRLDAGQTASGPAN